ncbi:MAG: hypothetical protein LLF89_10200 [Spirochaetaceae bacterium]|nr:hypothetical protein [Spirochaetaceae bacterium]
MADFITAVQYGLKAAEAAEHSRKEIDDVFKELSRQLHDAYLGELCITRKEIPKGNVISQLTQLFQSIGTGSQVETYWALVAWNPTLPDSPVKQLARWNQGRAGYPCEIAWGDQDYFCHDRGALEDTLALLLADPVVGESLHYLLTLKPTALGNLIEES